MIRPLLSAETAGLGVVVVGLSQHTYRLRSRSPSPKRNRECGRSPKRHHSHSLAGSWCASPPGCRGSCSCSPASFRRRHLLSLAFTQEMSLSISDQMAIPQWRYPPPPPPYQSRCSSSRQRSPRMASSHSSRSSSGDSCHQNRGLNSAQPTTSVDQRMLLLSTVPSRHSVHDNDENTMPVQEKQVSSAKNSQALPLEDFQRIFQETMKALSSDSDSRVQPPVLSLCRHHPFPKKRLLSYS